MRELSVQRLRGNAAAAEGEREFIRERLPAFLLERPDVTVAEFWPVAARTR